MREGKMFYNPESVRYEVHFDDGGKIEMHCGYNLELYREYRWHGMERIDEPCWEETRMEYSHSKNWWYLVGQYDLKHVQGDESLKVRV